MQRGASVSLGVLLLLGGIGGYWFWRQRPIPIERIRQNPLRYDGQRVNIRGKVTTSFDVWGQGFYVVEDQTGRITVRTHRGAPPQGYEVTVRGVVRKALQIQDQSLLIVEEEKATSRSPDSGFGF